MTLNSFPEEERLREVSLLRGPWGLLKEIDHRRQNQNDNDHRERAASGEDRP